MASKCGRKYARCCQQLFVFCILLQCSAQDQERSTSHDITAILELAVELRNNMVRGLGTILQERQLSWEQALTVRRLHDSLASRHISTVDLLPEVQRIVTNKTFSSPEQQTVLFLKLLPQNTFPTVQWDKYVSLLEAYNADSEFKLLNEINFSKLGNILKLRNGNIFDSVFKNIKLGYIFLTPTLLAGLLDNFPFSCIVPETNEALRDVVKILVREDHVLKEILSRIQIKSDDSFNDFLMNVLNYLGSNASPLKSADKLKIWMIVPFLKPDTCRNITPGIHSFHNRYYELFLAIRDDEFSPDITDARNDFMTAIENGKLDFSKYLTEFVPEDYGNEPLSILYGYLSRLSFSLPNAHPASAYVRTLLSHVKIKYITSKGGTFVPTTALDIALLLDSFNTLGVDLSETNTQIYRAFQSGIPWKEILRNFCYKRYSRPRTLFIAMVKRILLSDENIKLCHKIALKYFLEKVQNSINKYQSVQVSVSHNIVNPFLNCTVQYGKSMQFVSQPINVLNETIPLQHTELENEKQITVIAQKNERYSTITTPYNVLLSNVRTTEVISGIELPSTQTTNKTDSLSENEMDKLFTQRCMSNSDLDRKIKYAISNILQHIMTNKNGNIHVKCTDNNNNKLYVTINNQSQELPCTIQPSCANSSDVLWVDVPSLLTAVDHQVPQKSLQLVKDILTHKRLHGFDVRRYQSTGKLLYKLVKYALVNVTLHPDTKNAFTIVMNNIHMDGPGSSSPILVCLKYSKDEKTNPPDRSYTKDCSDLTTKEKGTKTVSVNIASLFSAIHPDTPEDLKHIVTTYLNRPAVIKHIHNLNLDIYASKGNVLENILTDLKSQGNKIGYTIKDAIENTIPFIQKEGAGSSNPDIQIICRTKNIHSASLSGIFQNEDIIAYVTDTTSQSVTSKGKGIPAEMHITSSTEHITTPITEQYSIKTGISKGEYLANTIEPEKPAETSKTVINYTILGMIPTTERETTHAITKKTTEQFTDKIVTTEQTEGITDEIVTTEQTTEEITDEIVTTEQTTEEITDEIVTTEQTTEEITDEIVTIEQTTEEIRYEIVTTEQTTEEITDEIVTTEQTTEEITDEIVTTEQTTEEIRDEIVTTEQTTEEITDEIVTTEQTTEEITDEIVTTEQTTEEITDQIVTKEQTVTDGTVEEIKNIIETTVTSESTEEITNEIVTTEKTTKIYKTTEKILTTVKITVADKITEEIEDGILTTETTHETIEEIVTKEKTDETTGKITDKIVTTEKANETDETRGEMKDEILITEKTTHSEIGTYEITREETTKEFSTDETVSTEESTDIKDFSNTGTTQSEFSTLTTVTGEHSTQKWSTHKISTDSNKETKETEEPGETIETEELSTKETFLADVIEKTTESVGLLVNATKVTETKEFSTTVPGITETEFIIDTTTEESTKLEEVLTDATETTKETLETKELPEYTSIYSTKPTDAHILSTLSTDTTEETFETDITEENTSIGIVHSTIEPNVENTTSADKINTESSVRYPIETSLPGTFTDDTEKAESFPDTSYTSETITTQQYSQITVTEPSNVLKNFSSEISVMKTTITSPTSAESTLLSETETEYTTEPSTMTSSDVITSQIKYSTSVSMSETISDITVEAERETVLVSKTLLQTKLPSQTTNESVTVTEIYTSDKSLETKLPLETTFKTLYTSEGTSETSSIMTSEITEPIYETVHSSEGTSEASTAIVSELMLNLLKTTSETAKSDIFTKQTVSESSTAVSETGFAPESTISATVLDTEEITIPSTPIFETDNTFDTTYRLGSSTESTKTTMPESTLQPTKLYTVLSEEDTSTESMYISVELSTATTLQTESVTKITILEEESESGTSSSEVPFEHTFSTEEKTESTYSSQKIDEDSRKSTLKASFPTETHSETTHLFEKTTELSMKTETTLLSEGRISETTYLPQGITESSIPMQETTLLPETTISETIHTYFTATEERQSISSHMSESQTASETSPFETSDFTISERKTTYPETETSYSLSIMSVTETPSTTSEISKTDITTKAEKDTEQTTISETTVSENTLIYTSENSGIYSETSEITSYETLNTKPLRKLTMGTILFFNETQKVITMSSSATTVETEIFKEEDSSESEVTSSTAKVEMLEKNTSDTKLSNLRVTDTTILTITPTPETEQPTLETVTQKTDSEESTFYVKETSLPPKATLSETITTEVEKIKQTTILSTPTSGVTTILPTETPISNETTTMPSTLSAEPIITTISQEKYNISEEWTPTSIDEDEFFSFPTIFQILTDENKTYLANFCSHPQIPIGIPNIKTLLEAVDTRVSNKSLDTVIKFFQTDTVNKLSNFYTDEILTKSEMLSKILIFVKSTYSDLESHIQEAISDVLLHIEFTGKGADESDFETVCVNRSDIIKKPFKNLTESITSQTATTAKVDSEPKLASFVKIDHEENITSKCEGKEMKIVVPSVQSLITVVDDTVPNSTIQMVIKFFEREDIENLVEHFSGKHTTRSRLLADLLNYIIQSYKNLEPHFLDAFQQILSHIKPLEQEILESDFKTVYICQLAKEKYTTPSYISDVEIVTEQSQQFTTTEIGTSMSAESTNIKLFTGTAAVPMQPEGEDFHFENIEDYQCPENQIAIILPNIRSLLKAVKSSIPKHSLKTVLDFFQKSNLAKLLKGVRIRQFETRAALLSEILSFIQLRYDDVLQPHILKAIEDVFHNIEPEGEGILQPDFTVVCQDVEQTTTPQPLPAHKIRKQPRITPDFSPTVATLPHHVTSPFMPTEETTVETSTYTTSTINVPIENKSQCRDDQVVIKVPNIKLLLQLMGKSVQKETVDELTNLFETRELLQILQDFNIDMYNTKAQLFSAVLTFIKDQYNNLDQNQINAIDTITKLIPHIWFENSAGLQPEILEICFDFQREELIITTPTYKFPENVPNQCTSNQIAVTVPDINSLLKAVHSSISQQSLSIFQNFFQINNISQKYTEFQIQSFDTRVESLIKILTYIKMTHTDMSLSVLNAIDDILNNALYDGEGALQPDFIVICENISKLQETTKTIQTTQIPQTNLDLFQTFQVSNTTESCPENQSMVILPDIYSLLMIVDDQAPKTQIMLIYDLFNIDILNKLQNFNTAKCDTNEKMLKNLLSFIENNVSELNSSQLTAVREISKHIRSSGNGAMKPEFIKFCLNTTYTGEASKIKLMPQECLEQMLVIDLPSLFEATDYNVSKTTKEDIIKEIGTFKIQNELKILNWDNYKTKGELLKDILMYLISNNADKYKDRLSKIMPHVIMNGSGANRPIFKFVCVPIEKQVIKIHSQEKCQQNPLYKSVYVINILSLLEAVKPTAPKLEKAAITLLLQRDYISMLLYNFDVKKYKSKGQLMKALLSHLNFESTIKPNELDNINTILCHITSDGPGALPPNVIIECDNESDLATIVIPRECGESSPMPTLIVDVATLLQTINENAITKERLDVIQSILQDAKVQKHFLDVYAEVDANRGKILKTLLNYAKSEFSKDENIVNTITGVLEHVSEEQFLPVVKFTCRNNISNVCGINSDGHAITPLYVLRPTKMFQSLRQNVPERYRETVWKYMTKLDFYKNIRGFDILKFKTQGELLKGILQHLTMKPLQDGHLKTALTDLIKSVRLDGPGKENIDLSTKCNFTISSNLKTPILHDMVHPMIISQPEPQFHKPSVSTSLKLTGLPKKCSDRNLVHMYAIDIPSLFEAMKPDISKILLKNVIDIIDTPLMQFKFKSLAWDKYDTKAHLLTDILSYVILNITQPEQVINAINKIISHLDIHGTGAQYPNFKFICVPSTQLNMSNYLNRPSIIKTILATCENDQGSLVTVLNIESLLEPIKQDTSLFSKAIATAFFQTPDFGKFINDLKIGNFKTRGEQLQALISFLLTKGGLEQIVQDAMKTLLDNIQLDGPGALPPDIKVVYQAPAIDMPTKLSACSDIMVIPSDETMDGMFMVDFPTLLTAIDPNAPLDLMPVIKNAIQGLDIHLTLMDFDWNMYETRGQLLRDILLLISEKTPRHSETHEAVDKLLPFILSSGHGAKPPVIKFEDYTEIQKIHNCGRGIKPLYVMRISSLFKIIKPGVSEDHKNLIASTFGRFDFYKKIRSFNFEKHNTKGEFLRELLAHLLVENSLNPDLVKAASSLILNVKSDGCADNIIDFNTVCNVTVPKTMSRCQQQTRNKTEMYESSRPGRIHIISMCFDNGTTEILAVNMSQLLDDIQLSSTSKLRLTASLEDTQVQKILTAFDWDNHGINGKDLLINIFQFLLTKLSSNYRHHAAIQRALSLVNSKYSYTNVPSFTFTCSPQEQKANILKNNFTNVSLLQELTRGPAIIKPISGKCDNGATPVLTVNIPVLLTSLKPNTPPLAKAIISTYLSRPNFHKILKNFSLASFRTRGEQLQELLIHLVTYTAKDTTLMKAIDKVLPNVQLEGFGKLEPSMKIVCNSTLHKIMQLPFASEIHTLENSILSPCIVSSSGITYQIDIPTIFYAIKPNAPRSALSKIIEYFTKPDFYIIMKGFDVESQKTNGDLLTTLLVFLVEKSQHEPNIVQAIQDILPFVHSDGSGGNAPNIIPNCPLHDTTQFKPPVQGPRLIDEHGKECKPINPNTPRSRGTTVFKIQTQSLLENLNTTQTKINYLKSLFNSENVSKYFNFLNLKKYPSQAEMLNGILSLIQNHVQLDEQNRNLINDMRSSIKYDGKEALAPRVALLCSPKHIGSNSEYLIFTTQETCYSPMPGMPYELHVETLLQTIKEDVPKETNSTLTTFFSSTNIHLYLQGFNIFSFKTRGEMMRNLLLFLASKPDIKTEFKKAMVSSIPFICIDGLGALAPIIITTCPDRVTHATISTKEIIDWDICKSSTKAIKTTKLKVSLFQALDTSKPNSSLKIMIDYIDKQDIMLTRLYKFDYQKYKTKGDLLQALLAFVWSHPESQEFEKEAAKILLPHVIFDGPGQEPPDFEESCYIPNGTIKFNKETGIQPLFLVYPTNKTCLNNVKNLPGIIVHRIEILSLFQALEPKIPQEQYFPVSTFLSKPYAYEYIRGIDVERYNTRGELLRAVLTFLRFTPRYIEPNVKEALMKILPSIDLSGPGKLLVDRSVECSPTISVHNLNSIDVGELVQTITKHKFSDSFNIIRGYITSPEFNLTKYITWIDMDQPITKGELLKLILLKILDKNPTIGKHILQVLSQIQENSDIAKEIFSFQIKKYKKLSLPFELDFMQLLQVLKPEAPNKSIAAVFNLLGKLNVHNYLEGFDASKYETKGKLLLGVLMFLQTKYDVSTELGKDILQLIPYVDLEHVGALPPIIKKVYITTNTSVNVLTVDLGTLYTVIPRENLTAEGIAALNAIFKYLSTQNVDYMNLLQGISTNLPLQLQLKMILNKLKVIGEISIKKHVAVLLDQIDEQLFLDSYQYREVIPEMDWIEVLHAIPDTGVPTEVTEGKKELYYFFLSSAFKTAIHSFRINFNYNRAKFLKVLLAYLRGKPEVSRIKTVKNAIAYVYMFIQEEGVGLESVQDDIILPEQQEEAMSAQNRIKELLYQVLGVIEQEGAFEILQTLQKLFDSSTKLNLETTYLGYDVLEEFPPQERLIIILRRIYHNYIMFLDQDTISAIDMVFISLGETKQQTSQSLHFLPIKIDELMSTVLGHPTPAKVAAAKETISTHIDLPTVPLGKSFQDIVPSILNLEPRPRLAVILRILWRIYLKEKDSELLEAIKSVYEYIQPHTLENEILTQVHHTAIVAALTGLIRPNAPSHVLNAKQTVIEQLKTQNNIYDKSLASLATKNLSPKELVAHALRRFREHQYKLQPKLWIAISTIFEFLGVPEHDYSLDDIEDEINIVDQFKLLTEEAGTEVASSKRLLLKYLVDKKQEISKIFRGQRVLLQYAPKDKMAIILTRLLRIYGEKLEPKIVTAVENILTRLNDTVPSEVDEEQIDIMQLLDTVIGQTAPERVIAAKDLVKNTLVENPSMIQSILQEVIIQEDYNEHRCLAIIIQHLYKKYKLEFNKEMIRSLMVIFDYLNISPETSTEDQFVGNVTFEPLFHKVFPENEIPNDVALAINKILNVLDSQVDVKHILHGINLWKLPLDTQASLILYRLSKHGANLTDDVKDAVAILLDTLDTSLEELAAEDIDESYTPEKLFNEAFRNITTPPEVQEAKGIVMHLLLSGSPVVKDIYRGIDFTNISSPTDRLMAILKNIHIKQQVFGSKMAQALKILSAFLNIKLGGIQIDPFTFDFEGIFDRTILSSSSESVRLAKRTLLNSIKRRPSIFKKILKEVSIEDYEHDNQIVVKILNAIIYYKNQTRLTTAADHLKKFLRGDPISNNESQLVMEYYSKDEEVDESGDIDFRMFQGDATSKSSKKHWKRKKSKWV